MKRFLAMFLTAAMVAVMLASCGSPSPAPEEKPEANTPEKSETPAVETTHIVFAHNRSEEDVVGRALIAASDYLYELTDGKYDFTIYPNGTYATNTDCMQAVIIGDLDATQFDTGIEWAERLGTLLAPYTFESYEHWLAFKETEAYTEYVQDMSDTIGIHHFGFYTFGFRMVTGNKIWKTPEEFANVKLRMAVQAPYPEIATVLGCIGAPLDANEVYVALQNGVFDGQENPYSDIISRKFYEVQHYIIKTEHVLSVGGLCCSQKLWDSLDAEAQEALTKAMQYVIDYVDKETIEADAENAAWLEEQGCEIVEIDKTPFQERAPLVFEKYPEFEYYWTKIQEANR